MGRSRALAIVAAVEALGILALVYALFGVDRADAAGARPEVPAIEAPTASTPADAGAPTADRGRPGERATATEPVGAAIPPAATASDRAVLHGRVTARRGGVSAWRLTVTAEGAAKPMAQPFFRDVADYAVPALRPGRYDVRVTADGFREHVEAVDVPAGVDRVRLDIALTPNWELRVLMQDADGRPLTEVLTERRKQDHAWFHLAPHAMATDVPPPAVLPTTDLRYVEAGLGRWLSADEAFMRGTSRLPRRYMGALALPEDKPVYVSALLRTVVLATERVGAGQEEVVLRVPLDRLLAALGTVRLRLVDAAGAPVAGARVGLSDSQSSGTGEPTDAEGRIELRGQRPGLLNVDVNAAGLALPWWNVSLQPGAVLDLGTLTLLPAVPLEARIEGVPAGASPQCSLVCLDPPPHAALQARVAHLGTQQDKLTGYKVAPGRYQLRTRAGGMVAFVDLDTRELGGAPLVVRLAEAPQLRVSARAATVHISMRDDRGRTIWDNWLQPGPPFQMTLPAGEYRVVVERLGAAPTERALHLGAGGADLDLR